jgi:DNA-binding CsgD family transcriptional regulator
LQVLGVLARDRCRYDLGRYDLAFRLLEESLAQGHHLENDHFTAWAHHQLGFVAALQHDWPRASRFLCGGMLLFRDLGKWRGVACSVLGLAVVAEGLGEHGRAARLLGAADALRERTGVSWWPSHQEQFEQSRSDARGAVGEQAFAVECTVGGSLTRDAIVDLAVAVSDNMTDAPGTPPSIDRDAPDRTFAAEDLTRREREVAALIARGRTNAELARALCLSERTVEAHARNIRRKFGLVTRAQLVAWAARQFREPSQ